jgi:hypothetical protein
MWPKFKLLINHHLASFSLCQMKTSYRCAKPIKSVATSTAFRTNSTSSRCNSRNCLRNEVWRAAMLGLLGGTVAAVTLIEAFARSWL